ncbi:hypothetical protein L486_08275 [Kwoniella mangroviensis CBS 10435]|uniref:Uncharacterized protein n=1 Tax=Kwoniella mangroviensis CBS 10435 TaxID=1331196 RepID=A0A1B9IFZ8_9TREE|nr:hypothetical protein L486_08275 [Kwoniella mangroviensis CBS 10435]
MPKYLESFGDTLYLSNEEEQQAELQQHQPQLPSKSTPLSTHPLAQALFQSIYNKGFVDGASSTIFQSLSTYFTSHPILTTTMVLLIGSGSIALSARRGTGINPTKRLLFDAGSNLSRSTREAKSFGTSLPTLARTPPFSSPSASSGGLAGGEYDKALDKLREDIHAARDLFDKGEKEESKVDIGTQLEGKVDVRDGKDRSSGLDGRTMLDAMSQMLAQIGEIGEGKKIIMDLSPDGKWSDPKIVDSTRSDPEIDDSSIPSTYLPSSKGPGLPEEGCTPEDVKKINAETLSSPMANSETWTKARFAIIGWGEEEVWNGTGNLTIKFWDSVNPDQVFNDKMIVRTLFKEGIPEAIYHNGLLFQIEETPEDLDSGEPIWKFEKLLVDVKKVVEMGELQNDELYNPSIASDPEEDLNEPTMFDELIANDRSTNAHIFRDAVPTIEPKHLIKAVENDQRVEFWLDEKLGDAKAVGGSGKIELWKVRVGIYELYDKPAWSELEALVYFNGPPMKIAIDPETGYSVDLFPGDDGQYVVNGQGEDGEAFDN